MTNFLLDKSIFSRLLNLNPQWGKGRCVLIYLLQKRELALKKFKASKERKKAYIQELEKSMRQEYKERTGKEAVSFTVW